MAPSVLKVIWKVLILARFCVLLADAYQPNEVQDPSPYGSLEQDSAEQQERKPSQANSWPLRDDSYGDISSIAVHPTGELFILHRGSHMWREDSFNASNVYQELDKGAIPEDVLIGVDSETGEKHHHWGRNRFYMPHGLTIDEKGNFWITDVALHQVFKVDPEQLEVAMALGEAGVPGADKTHFCKPTDVAVASDGTFFVADGYCNSRVIKFSPKGDFLLQFGRASQPGSLSLSPSPSDSLNIPHSLALVENYDLICVANREDEKIQCFTAGLAVRKPDDTETAGKFVLQVAHPQLSRVFAIHYTPALNKLYAVNGVGFSLQDKPLQIFSVDLSKNDIQAWNPEEEGAILSSPHDITLSPNGQYIYVADLAPRPTVWKFVNDDFKA
ncbi:hypothetical protein RvY_11643 [Ramazzottius varieornatus]|uniref:peptidylamidoglycolate lyase n=1 Tax=Ramazzottius varieornatus TaxID=947166 RepID=A0A1D1VIU8_RAMVA|nr:hypothetical protein RvY_11643 [Ramazzottius varieornatus]